MKLRSLLTLIVIAALSCAASAGEEDFDFDNDGVEDSGDNCPSDFTRIRPIQTTTATAMG